MLDRQPEANLRQWARAALISLTLSLGMMATSGQEAPSLEQAIALHDAGEFAEAFTMFLPLAEAGIIKAQNRLAHMYYWGEGTEKDPQKHHEWSMRSAALGDPYGAFDVATAYFSGRLFPADPFVAMDWLTQSAEGGDRYALLGLGMIYIYGDYVPKDVEHGVDLVRQSAEAGDIQAQQTLGALLLYGETATSQTRRDGLKWMRHAAERGHAAAQYLLADRLISGQQPDVIEAAMWLVLSANSGCVVAGPALQSLFSAISAGDAVAALQRAASWEKATPSIDPHDHRGHGPLCDTQLKAWR